MPESNSAARQLAWHYENPMARALEAHRAGVSVVGLSSNTVPWEMIRAAGLFPVVLRPGPGATPAADEYMEQNVFQARIRRIFDAVVRGEWDFLRAIILPRTSEQEYKLFLYLREVAREVPRDGMPPVYLYDLLHSRSAESHAYGIARTKELRNRLEQIAGRPVSTSDLADAAAESNAAREALSRLLQLRHGAPRISGTEALPLIGAFWLLPRAEYAKLALEAVEIVGRRARLPGARLMIFGAPLDNLRLHAAIESHGAVVVAEDDWWGTLSVGADITVGNDAIDAIFATYYAFAPSPRVFPAAGQDRWFEAQTSDAVDGVVFYLPPDDCVAGWDYPRQKRFLDGIGIPSLVVREDADEKNLSSATHESIQQFVRTIDRVQ